MSGIADEIVENKGPIQIRTDFKHTAMGRWNFEVTATGLSLRSSNALTRRSAIKSRAGMRGMPETAGATGHLRGKITGLRSAPAHQRLGRLYSSVSLSPTPAHRALMVAASLWPKIAPGLPTNVSAPASAIAAMLSF
jgi:hypothetical protein